MCSIDNLPAQLPREASQYFGDNLMPFIKEIVSSLCLRLIKVNYCYVVTKSKTVVLIRLLYNFFGKYLTNYISINYF